MMLFKVQNSPQALFTGAAAVVAVASCHQEMSANDIFSQTGSATNRMYEYIINGPVHHLVMANLALDRFNPFIDF